MVLGTFGSGRRLVVSNQQVTDSRHFMHQAPKVQPFFITEWLVVVQVLSNPLNRVDLSLVCPWSRPSGTAALL